MTGSISFNPGAYSANESAASVAVTVVRTGDSSGTATVDYATGGGTGTAGQDYTTITATLIFAAGETTRTITLPLIDDNIYEGGNETFNLTLSKASGASLVGPSTAVVTILENDFKPGLGFNGPDRIAEPTTGITNAIYTISLTNPSVQTVSIDYATADGSAHAGSDYVQTSGRVIFNPLETTKTFTVQVNADAIGEGSENFFIDLTNQVNTASQFNFHLPITIIEAPNGAFQFSAISYSVQEGDGDAEVTVIRAGGSNGTTTVSYETVNFTAVAGSDYTARSGTLTFAPGETTKTILIPIIDDSLFEDREAFRVEFRVATGGADFGSPRTTGVFILDNDALPGDTWTPVALSSDQVDIQTWKQSDGKTYAKVKLTFPDSGYRVQDQHWGQPSSIDSSGNNFTVDSVVEHSNGASIPAAVTAVHIYELGLLAPGNYAFTFKTLGTATKTQNFTVSGQPLPATQIDDQSFFVAEHYRDFLGREPDAPGLAFWTDNITKCNDPARRPAGQTVAQCIDKQRETTSAAFFLSPEFQYTGYYVYRLHRGGLGRAPYLSEFTPDRAVVSNGIIVNNQLSGAVIDQNKLTLAEQFVQRAEFVARYGALTNQQYVDKLFETTGINASPVDRTALVNGLNNMSETRASVLLKVVDGIHVISEGNQQFTTSYGEAFYDKQFNPAFVHMQYFGYMQRDPDAPGYAFWLGKLNTFGNYLDAQMVLSFIVSPEYRARFGAP